MKTMTQDQLRSMQMRVLHIYKEFAKICDENNLRYFAVGGTAIGAVRHGGFIPWDDDIDIAMPRKDYEEFKRLSGLLPSSLMFVDLIDNDNSLTVFGKVMDPQTCYTNADDAAMPEAYYGIFLDIMPLDGVPNNEIHYRVHWMYLRVLLSLQNLIVKYENGVSTNSLMKKQLRIFAGTLAKLGILDKRKLKQKYIQVASKYNFDESRYSAYIWQFVINAGVNVRARFPTEDFKRYVDMPFEDTTMRMPINYKSYLSIICPDYMTPPPKEKQVPHHDGILDFNKSYLEYAEEVRNRQKKSNV